MPVSGDINRLEGAEAWSWPLLHCRMLAHWLYGNHEHGCLTFDARLHPEQWRQEDPYR